MHPGRSAAYCQYYNRQQGGDIPIFRGTQHGGGIGDVLRGILRFIVPVAMRGISTFATSTMSAQDQGASLAEAARSALSPTLSAITSEFTGGGGGGGGNSLFKGEHGVPRETSSLPTLDYAYKSAQKRKFGNHSGSKKAKHAKHSTTKYNF